MLSNWPKIINSHKKKGACAPVGIKNSWKYEKDLIILNILHRRFTITHAAIVGELSVYC